MTFYTLTRAGGPWTYQSLGFTATNGAVLDGSASTPAITSPPDQYWTVAGSVESGITRFASPSYVPGYTEPADGAILVWNAATNIWEGSLTPSSSYIAASQKGAASGVAPLDSGSRVAEANLPANLAASALSATYATVAGASPKNLPAWAGSRTGPFDAETGWYNLTAASFRKTRAYLAQARSGAALAKLAFIGDSTVAGTGSSTPSTKSWPAQVKTMLADRGYTSSGTGFVSLYHETGADSRWNISAMTDMGRSTTLMYADAAAESCTFTSDTAGTVLELYYSNMGGNFNVSVDGGGSVGVTTNATSTMGTYRVTGLANTTHSIVATWSTGQMQIFGAFVGVDTGVRILNNGIGGQRSADLAGASWHMVANHAAALFGAHCIGIMCEINDPGNGVTAAAQKASLQTVITAAKAQGADVFLVTAVPYSTLDLSTYTSNHYDLADTNSIPLLDIQARWSSVQATNTALGIMADTVHPNASGYGDIAWCITNALLGQH